MPLQWCHRSIMARSELYFVRGNPQQSVSDVESVSVRHYTGLILGLHPANERRCYKVMPSLIGWVQTWNQPCYIIILKLNLWYVMELNCAWELCRVCCKNFWEIITMSEVLPIFQRQPRISQLDHKGTRQRLNELCTHGISQYLK